MGLLPKVAHGAIMSGDNKLSEQQIARFKKTFASIDSDGDGKVSRDELVTHLRTLEQCPSDDMLGRMMTEALDSADGPIDYPGFLSVMAHQMRYGDLIDEIKQIFNMLDNDQDGFITPAELERMMPLVNENLSKEEIKEMIQVADANGDGKVSLEEFVQLVVQ